MSDRATSAQVSNHTPPLNEGLMAHLMVRAQDGDRAAYRRLLDEVAAHVRALVEPHATYAPWVEDIVRECLMAVHYARATYHPSRPFGPWLQAITSHRLAAHDQGAPSARPVAAGARSPRQRPRGLTVAFAAMAFITLVAGTTVSLRAQAQPAPAVPHYSGPREDAPIPRPGMTPAQGRVAVVVTDPQNDFLSPDGVAWGVVGESVKENGTVENIERLLKVAKASDIPVFVSPHYYYPHDHRWTFGGALEVLMHAIGMFDRKGALTQEAFEGSGADWLARYKPYLNDGKTVITSPHKVFGPETNDLVLQLRKAGISQVVLAGMSANLCTESHMRELLEQGFEVVVVTDATAAAKLPGFDGYEAAYVNFRLIASDIWSTADAVKTLSSLDAPPSRR